MSCKPPVEYANPRDLAQVQEPLRSRLWTAQQDAPRGGLILVSGKRTDWQQYLLRQSHGCMGRECDRGCKGKPTTAVPGRSNHRNLTAQIAAADMGGIDLRWLADHEAEYGLHRPVPGELWHFECNGTPTRKINRYGTLGNPNEGHHWVPCGPGDVDGVRGTVYARGGYDNQVAEIQIRLKKLRGEGWAIRDVGEIDGRFGDERSRTSGATVDFHNAILGLQEYTGQALWPRPADPYYGVRKVAMLRWWTA